MEPKPRGYALEKVFVDLMRVSGIQVEEPFTNKGEQIDGAIKHDSNVLLTLQTEDGDQLALPKVIVRDPIKRTLEHVDLVAVRKGETVTVEVPITLVGQPAPDTLIEQQTMTLTVEAEATHLPTGFEVSIAGLGGGQSIAAKDVKLPAGVKLAQDPEHVIVQGQGAPTLAEVEAENAPEVVEVEAPAEADAAAEGDAPEA